MSIIGKIVWQPQNPSAGQSVKIDVCGQDGKPLSNQQAAYVTIDGIPGSSQYVQLPFPGDKQISVIAKGTDGTVERKTATITIAPAVPSQATMKKLADPANKSLTADQIAWLKATSDVHLLTVSLSAQPTSPYKVGISLKPLSSFVKPPAGSGQNAPVLAAASPMSSAYTWNFGDGSPEVTTKSPFVDHDFETALDSEQEFLSCHVKVSVADADSNAKGEIVSVGPVKQSYLRTMTVHNPYVHCKKRGYVVPKVTASDWATKDGSNFVGIAEIKNNEAVPIKLVSRLLIPALLDTDATILPTALVPIDPPIVVPAKGSVQVKVTAPFTDVPADAIGFTAVFTEQAVVKAKGDKAASIPAATVVANTAKSGIAVPKTSATNPIVGLKIRASAHFRVDPRQKGKTPPVASEKVGAGASTTKPRDNKKITPLGGVKPDPIPSNETYPLPPKVGNPCDPDNPPEGMPEGHPGDLVCQWTPKTKQVTINPQFLNARKGDVILCPSSGNASLVDGMLMQVNPPQLYGHSGIMTRNFEQITHCTASQQRIQDNSHGDWLPDQNDDEGFDPDALEYAWPGVLTQTVDHAVNGETIKDPGGTSYSFQSFNSTPSEITFNNQFLIIPPLVVKPDPVLETAQTRKLLNAAADFAFQNTQNYHYSFYGFTNPASDALNAPSQSAGGLDSSSAWAYGTKGAVCSSFIWQMMKQSGVNAYGKDKYATKEELSQYAKQTLGLNLDQNSPGTLDGLAYYTAAERLACGQWLWHAVNNAAYSQASFADKIVAPSALVYPADQLCNAFATNDCATPNEPTTTPLIDVPVIGNVGGITLGSDSQPWQNPGDSNAVSPSNLLAWNGPDKDPNCVLGYSEPLVYCPSTSATVPVYEWAAPKQYCQQISGLVELNNEPQPDVTVTIPGLDSAQTGTGSDGKYSFKNIPNGKWVIKAQKPFKTPDGELAYYDGQVLVNVNQKGAMEAPTIKMRAPDEPNIRTVVISGHASIDCSVWSWGSHHWRAYPTLGGNVIVGKGKNGIGYWADQEPCHSAVGQFNATVCYNADDSVLVTLVVQLDPQNGGRSRTYTMNILPEESYTFIIGDKNSILNSGPYQYNGGGDGTVPGANSGDLEACNDCLCCAITFANKEWPAGDPQAVTNVAS
jgi:hypothetical protein